MLCPFFPALLSVFLSVLLRYSTKREKEFNSKKLPADSVWWRAKCNPTTTTRWKKKIYIYIYFFPLPFLQIHFTHIHRNFTITHGGLKVAHADVVTVQHRRRRLIGLAFYLFIFLFHGEEFFFFLHVGLFFFSPVHVSCYSSHLRPNLFELLAVFPAGQTSSSRSQRGEADCCRECPPTKTAARNKNPGDAHVLLSKNRLSNDRRLC